MADCLLIDDSRLARRICRSLLESAGYDVTEAVDGADGLAQAALRRFDIILVDQFMPVMEGLDFIRHYRARADGAVARLILCSSDGAPALQQKARELGADGYLNKPYTAGALARQLCDLRSATN